MQMRIYDLRSFTASQKTKRSVVSRNMILLQIAFYCQLRSVEMVEPQTKHLLPFEMSYNGFAILVQVLYSQSFCMFVLQLVVE